MHKAVGKAISDTVVQRLKTPLIATFMFSWLVVNHAVVLQFTFETLPNKVALAKSLEIGWWYGLALPALVSLLYILLIPALQLGLDWLVLKILGESRKKHDIKVARNAAESTQDYQSKLLEKNMTKWENEKAELLNQIDDLDKQIGELVGQLQDSDTKKGFLTLQTEVMEKAVNDAIDSLERPRMNFGSDYEDQRSREEVCDEVIEILEQVVERDKNKIPF
ncbi:hypothetical protein VSAK1_00527 [Vibrio mediterranei AK1]|uniref:hypothetical protein n=1 Tax=Vibrio mediterranei TaxID=689 RepID=UPI000154151F|nr:hypothetical protein [Vibrio mediterranei]EDL53571.1 hypothetical protein VSAK1_00527 [Vibrio mediterranei AK1]